MRSLGRNLPIRFAEWIWYKWNKWWLIAATLWKCDFSRCFHALYEDFIGWQHCQEAAHRPPTGETLESSGYILARCKEHCLKLHQAALQEQQCWACSSVRHKKGITWKSEVTRAFLPCSPESSLCTLLYSHGVWGLHGWRAGVEDWSRSSQEHPIAKLTRMVCPVFSQPCLSRKTKRAP